MQLVLIQSSDSFYFVVVFWFFFSYLLNFFFFLFVIFILMRGWGVGRESNRDLGLRGFSSLHPTGKYDVSKSELESGMKQFQHKQAQKFSLLADWKQKSQDGIWWIPTQWGTRAFGPLYFALVSFVFFRDMLLLTGLEVDSSLCSAGFAILISSIIDICNGENIWTVAFFILVTCDAI